MDFAGLGGWTLQGLVGGCMCDLFLSNTRVFSEDVKLTNIGAQDIAGGSLKLILGLVWCLIQRYHLTTVSLLLFLLSSSQIFALVLGYYSIP